ncbi:MAG: restriction endonuclease subunit S [Pseudomonadota bacterium]
MKVGLLGDNAEILSGFAFKSENFNSDKQGMPLIRIRDVVPGETSTYYDGSYEDRFVVHRGEILIGMDGDFNRARWKGRPALLNQRVCKIKAHSQLHDGYLFHLLPEILQVINDRTAFVTVKHLSAKDLREVEIPLPPIDEQKRIAAILDQADALRRLRTRALDRLNALGQAIFHEMFGEADASWPERRIADVVENARTGPFGSQLLSSELVDVGIPVLGIDNVVTNGFSWGKSRFITDEKYQTLKRFTVHPGDVLITIMGTLGRCIVIPNDIPVAINTKHICCLTPHRAVIDPEFLRASFLFHPDIRQQISDKTLGAIMPGLNMGIIKDLKIRVPPVALQQEFSTRNAATSALLREARRHAAYATTLFTSLQHRAFRGEL